MAVCCDAVEPCCRIRQAGVQTRCYRPSVSAPLMSAIVGDRVTTGVCSAPDEILRRSRDCHNKLTFPQKESLRSALLSGRERESETESSSRTAWKFVRESLMGLRLDKNQDNGEVFLSAGDRVSGEKFPRKKVSPAATHCHRIGSATVIVRATRATAIYETSSDPTDRLVLSADQVETGRPENSPRPSK